MCNIVKSVKALFDIQFIHTLCETPNTMSSKLFLYNTYQAKGRILVSGSHEFLAILVPMTFPHFCCQVLPGNLNVWAKQDPFSTSVRFLRNLNVCCLPRYFLVCTYRVRLLRSALLSAHFMREMARTTDLRYFFGSQQQLKPCKVVSVPIIY